MANITKELIAYQLFYNKFLSFQAPYIPNFENYKAISAAYIILIALEK